MALNLSNIVANIEHFTFTVEGVSTPLRVVEFSGDEAISQLFSFQLEIASEEGELGFTDVIGKHATLSFYGAGDSERYANGIISRMEQLDVGRRYTFYQLELVPQVSLLNYRYDSRIFQNLTVEAIIQQVLNNANIPAEQFSFALQGSYAPREYCVQYRESDFNFISRLMEEEGLFYFFEHTEDSHKLVIADNSGAHNTIVAPAQVRYRAPTTMLSEQEYISRFHYAESIQPGKVVLKDFNFQKPALNLASEKESDSDTELEVYDFPGEFQEPERGDQLAGVRLEALRTAKQCGMVQSNTRRLLPGFRFTLTDYPRDSFNQEYLITRLTQSASQPQALDEGGGSQGGSYSNQFECIPVSVPFRPTQRARKPLMEGVQTAIVVGPGGEEIYTDEFGRVKVQFHWDRLGENNENSSCWIRVSQAWAGGGWGSMNIPRIGQEVIVNFIEGDPDRPIVTGRVYHGTNKPPYTLPDEKTKSTLKSNCCPGGGGSNELRFEDKKDAEEIYLHGQKDWTIAIENDKNQEIGHDESRNIVNDDSLSVGNNRTKNVEKDESETIGNDKSIDVKNNHAENIGKNMTLDIGGDRTENISGNHSETIGKDMGLDVGKGRTISVAENHKETIGKNMSLDVDSNATISVGKSMSTTVEKKILIDAGDSITLSCGQASITMKKDGKIQISGSGITIEASNNLVLKGSKITEN